MILIPLPLWEGEGGGQGGTLYSLTTPTEDSKGEHPPPTPGLPHKMSKGEDSTLQHNSLFLLADFLFGLHDIFCTKQVIETKET